MRVKNKEIVCKWAKKKEIQKCLSERKKTWKSRNLCNERGVNHEVRGKAETLHCTDKYILVRKMDRTTYWGYSLSWYNLAGERRNGEIKRKERGERKGQEEKEREREKKDKREKKKHFTSFKVHSADNQALLWGHHPGTGSESGSPFSSISPINHPSFYPRIPKHSRRQDSYSGSIQSENIMGTLLLSSWWY